MWQQGCGEISNEQVVHLVKQYFTLLKVVEKLKKKLYTPPQEHLLDLRNLIPDIMDGEPEILSLRIFQPEAKIVGLHNAELVSIPYTALHMYNQFLLNELPVFNEDQIKERVSLLVKHISRYVDNIILELSQACI